MGAYTMPSLGADMASGTVVRWLVAPGDTVHKGDLVATIETEKATIDAEIFEDGVVESLLVREGDEVPVGTPLATIAPSGPARPAHPARPTGPAHGRAARPAGGRRPARPGAPVPGGPTAPPDGRVHSPVVRHLAESLGVDLARVAGTGPGGSVTRADVQAATPSPAAPSPAAPPPAAPPAGASQAGGPAPLPSRGRAAVHVRASPFVRRRAAELGIDLATVEATGPGEVVTPGDLERARPAPAPGRAGRTPEEQQRAMRRQIAALMARSKREIPHYYLETTIDLGPGMAFLAGLNAPRPPSRRLLPVALLLKATALAAREVPEVNGFFVDDEFHPSESVHLGVAIALRQGGLVAPAIHDVDALGLDEVMAAMTDLVARARAGRLRSSEMADPTLTVTSLGDLGVDSVIGVIYPPQVALVGFGRVGERPFAIGGLVGARPVVTATLAADHRVSDGIRGARFLSAVGRHLQEPEEL